MQPATEPAPDTLTVIAIAFIVCAIGTILHEGVGHGGACVLSGGNPLVVSSVHFDCSKDTRFISAGGTIVNFIAGFIGWALSRLVVNKTRLRYFLWLFMTTNLFDATGYFLFSGVGGIGDWADVVRGHNPVWAWRVGLALFGIATYLLCVRFCLMELRPFLGNDFHARIRRARRLTVIPYLAIGILAVIAGALNPVDPLLIFISAAAASFGGLSGLAWMSELLQNPKIRSSERQMPPLRRSLGWVVAGVVVAVLFIAFVGPGIKLAH